MGNAFRDALNSGKRLFGTHICLNDYRVCEMLGKVGFDYFWIDMEHTPTDFHTVKQHLIAAKASGQTPCMVRVTWNDIPSIKRVLEMGPDAIVVPMVNSVEDAKRAIDTCIYPPEGKRGFGPSRAVSYGIESIREYIEGKSKETVRLIMIESIDAVEAMEEMAKIPYLDGFVIGPMDMSGSVGELGYALQGKKTNRLVELSVKKAHNCGKVIGLSTGAADAEELTHWLNKGVDFISASTDIASVISGGYRVLETMQECSKKLSED
ncbi:MAG: aldolase [Lachnospiraceae bacterium]|nr:aldolase [Lachnospiraceae bacterium]